MLTFSEDCVDSNYQRQGSLDRLSGTEELKTNRINIMTIKLSNETQKTVTINGKRYNSERVIREFSGEENQGGSYFINSSMCMNYDDDFVVISCIDGDFVRLER